MDSTNNRPYVLVFAALLLAACAPQWVNPDKTRDEYHNDMAACKRYATQKSEQGSIQLQFATDPGSNNFYSSWSKAEAEAWCMKDKGWRPLQMERP